MKHTMTLHPKGLAPMEAAKVWYMRTVGKEQWPDIATGCPCVPDIARLLGFWGRSRHLCAKAAGTETIDLVRNGCGKNMQRPCSDRRLRVASAATGPPPSRSQAKVKNQSQATPRTNRAWKVSDRAKGKEMPSRCYTRPAPERLWNGSARHASFSASRRCNLRMAWRGRAASFAFAELLLHCNSATTAGSSGPPPFGRNCKFHLAHTLSSPHGVSPGTPSVTSMGSK